MGGLSVRQEVLSLELRDPFRIARSDHATDDRRITTVVVELRDERYPDLVGVGEGYPDRFYGETPATMATVLPMLLEAIGEPSLDRAGADSAAAAMDGAIRGHGAAKCAIDIALHDLIGQVTGQPVHALLGGAKHESLLGYATGGGSVLPLARMAEKVDFYLGLGFRAFKFGTGATMADGTETGQVEPAAAADFEAQKLAFVRSHVGPDVTICLDGHQDNLETPGEGNWAARGRFTAEARRQSVQFALTRHRRALGLGGATLILAAVGLGARRRA